MCVHAASVFVTVEDGDVVRVTKEVVPADVAKRSWSLRNLPDKAGELTELPVTSAAFAAWLRSNEHGSVNWREPAAKRDITPAIANMGVRSCYCAWVSLGRAALASSFSSAFHRRSWIHDAVLVQHLRRWEKLSALAVTLSGISVEQLHM